MSVQTTVKALHNIFATRGLPEFQVSDNGPAFLSEEFQTFMKGNRIHNVKTSPYHSACYGLTELAVQTFKEAMKERATGDIKKWLAWFLFKH